MTKEEIRRAIEAVEPSPGFFAARGSQATEFITSHRGFRSAEEITLLGLMVKYACINNKTVTIV